VTAHQTPAQVTYHNHNHAAGVCAAAGVEPRPPGVGSPGAPGSCGGTDGLGKLLSLTCHYEDPHPYGLLLVRPNLSSQHVAALCLQLCAAAAAAAAALVASCQALPLQRMRPLRPLGENRSRGNHSSTAVVPLAAHRTMWQQMYCDWMRPGHTACGCSSACLWWAGTLCHHQKPGCWAVVPAWWTCSHRCKDLVAKLRHGAPAGPSSRVGCRGITEHRHAAIAEPCGSQGTRQWDDQRLTGVTR
jgi:hypothetical protein